MKKSIPLLMVIFGGFLYIVASFIPNEDAIEKHADIAQPVEPHVPEILAVTDGISHVAANSNLVAPTTQPAIQVNNFTAQELDQAISSIDSAIDIGNYVAKANNNQLTLTELEQFRGLLRQRDLLFEEKVQRMLMDT